MYLVGPAMGFTWKMTARNIGYSAHYDNTKSKVELGIKYRTLEETLRDQINQLITKGIVKNAEPSFNRIGEAAHCA